jgi:hypothetical protein
MFDGTKIKKKVQIQDFLKFIEDYEKEQIECSPHTFFRLSEKQRKIFTCKELKKIIIKEKPFLVGAQYNKNYAIFYKYQNRNLKIIIDLNYRKIKIVTFYFIEEWQIPKI